jgi:vacuolar protein sorting-associated protein VTA1
MENLPESLNMIKPFLVRAEEMKVADTVISYYCYRYAVQLAMDVRKQNPTIQEITNYLGNMLNVMEAKKKDMGEIPEPKVHFEKFITMLFISADNDDRKTGSTKKTAQKFLILSYFIEAFNVFEEIPPDWEEKRIYCKWKTADILKALKNGEKPLPGGPGERDGVNKEERKNEPPASFQTSFPVSAPSDYSYTPSQNSYFPPTAGLTDTGNQKPWPTAGPSGGVTDTGNQKPWPTAGPSGGVTDTGNQKPWPNAGPSGQQGLPNNTFYPENPTNTGFPANPINPVKPTKAAEPVSRTQEPPPLRPQVVQPERRVEPQARGGRVTQTPEQRKMIEQAKKFGLNGVQELEYKNISQAVAAFQQAIKALENYNN